MNVYTFSNGGLRRSRLLLAPFSDNCFSATSNQTYDRFGNRMLTDVGAHWKGMNDLPLFSNEPKKVEMGSDL